MEHEVTPFVAADERSLVRGALIGLLWGIVVFWVITLVIVRIGFSDESWGFAVVVASFAAPWAGVFFGTAAGAAFVQLRAERAAVAPPVANSSTSAPPIAPNATIALHT